jgi:hypothetical protein
MRKQIYHSMVLSSNVFFGQMLCHYGDLVIKTLYSRRPTMTSPTLEGRSRLDQVTDCREGVKEEKA